MYNEYEIILILCEDVFLCEEFIMYQTKQKQQLIDFFKNNNGLFSINDIIDSVCPDGKGKSTVYRIISQMTEAKLLIKVLDSSKSVLYQYIGEGTDCCSHFHMQCSQCGTLIHLDCDHFKDTYRHFMEEHGFILDMKKTVLYGICKNCTTKGAEK